MIPTTSETLPPVTLVKRLKAVRKPQTRSSRSADNATSFVRMRISEKYSKNVLMAIVGLIPAHNRLKTAKVEF